MQSKNLNLLLMLVIAIMVGAGIYWYSQYSTEEIYVDASLSSEQQSNIAATLAYQQGDVMAMVDDAEWVVVDTDTVLHEGDAVKTGVDSKAIVELENGDAIRLGYSTEIQLTNLNKTNVLINQESGASYSRVAKNVTRTYEIEVGTATIQAVGTAFDVVKTTEQVDVNVVESKVKVITDTINEEVEEGKKVTIKDTKAEVSDIDRESLTNDWYTWNKEEDSKTDDNLGVLEPYAGPDVTITSPESGTTVTVSEVTIVGTVSDVAATLMINDSEVTNESGAFTHSVSLSPGKNMFTVVAENSSGYKTYKEVKVIYQTNVSVSATPIALKGETEDDGVHLSWNESTGSTFQYYKVVRSKTNANLVYPADGYVAKKNMGEESYTDTDVVATGTYYYRVCEVMSGEKVFCSNVIHMMGKKAQDEDINDDSTDDSEEGEDESEGSASVMSVAAEESGVGIYWTDTSENSGFKYYKVVRSETNSLLRYPDDGYIAVKSDSDTSYRDFSAVNGTSYYYRICTVGDTIYCSNVVQVTAINNNAAPDAVTLSGSYSYNDDEDRGEIALSWTKSTDSDFSHYKIVWSNDNSNLDYSDGYFKAISNISSLSYTDSGDKAGARSYDVDLSDGTHYYRICVRDSAAQVTCSNKITFIDGVVQ